MKLINNRGNRANNLIDEKSLLKKLIIKSLQGTFQDKSAIERRNLKNQIKQTTLKMAQQQVLSTAGDLLSRLLAKLTNKTPEELDIESKLLVFASQSKIYEFGTGNTKLVKKNKFIAALNEFSKFYETVVCQDLKEKKDSGKFDYLSLIHLLKMYLTKVMTKFSGWSEKDQKMLDQIIDRTKKAFFSIKLNKKFIQNKQVYMGINVFERLNSIETFSLTRLFKTIKGFLFNYMGQVQDKQTISMGDQIIELSLPRPLPADQYASLPVDILADQNIKDQYADMFGNVSDQSHPWRKNQTVIQSTNFGLREYDSKLENYKDRIFFGEDHTLKTIEKQNRADYEQMKKNFRFENMDQMLEKIVARALFELVDFSKIEQIYDLHVDKDNRLLFSQRSALVDSQKIQAKKSGMIKDYSQRINTISNTISLRSYGLNNSKNKSINKMVAYNQSEKGLLEANNHLIAVKKDLTMITPMPTLLNESYNSSSKSINTVKHEELPLENDGSMQYTVEQKNQEEFIKKTKKIYLGKKDQVHDSRVAKKTKDSSKKNSPLRKKIKNKKLVTSAPLEKIKSLKIEFGVDIDKQTAIKNSVGAQLISRQQRETNLKIQASMLSNRKSEKHMYRIKNLKSNRLKPSKTDKKLLDVQLQEVTSPTTIQQKSGSKFDKKNFTSKFISSVFQQYVAKEENSKEDKVNEQIIKQKKDSKIQSLDTSIVFDEQKKTQAKNEVKQKIQPYQTLRSNKDAHSITNMLQTFDQSRLDQPVKKIDSRNQGKKIEKPSQNLHLLKEKTKFGNIIKGGNYDILAPVIVKKQKKQKVLDALPESEFLVKGVNPAISLQYNQSFNVFNSFKKYNHDLIARAKVALLEALSPECIMKIFNMDPECVEELKNKVETRLMSFIKTEIYLKSDMMRLYSDGLVENAKDFKSMPDKRYITHNFKFNLRDLKIDVKKII